MRDMKLATARPFAAAGARARLNRIIGLVAVRAPVAAVLARFSIEYDDAVIAVAIGNKKLVGFRVDPHIGRAADFVGVLARRLGRVAPAQLLAQLENPLMPGCADLHHELTILRELQDHCIPGVLSRDPDMARVVDM